MDTYSTKVKNKEWAATGILLYLLWIILILLGWFGLFTTNFVPCKTVCLIAMFLSVVFGVCLTIAIFRSNPGFKKQEKFKKVFFFIIMSSISIVSFWINLSYTTPDILYGASKNGNGFLSTYAKPHKVIKKESSCGNRCRYWLRFDLSKDLCQFNGIRVKKSIYETMHKGQKVFIYGRMGPLGLKIHHFTSKKIVFEGNEVKLKDFTYKP